MAIENVTYFLIPTNNREQIKEGLGLQTVLTKRLYSESFPGTEKKKQKQYL